MGKLSVQTARDRVREYCRDNHLTHPQFADMLHLAHSTLQRFMGAGRETTGKHSLAYPAINKFLQAQDRKRRKEQEEESMRPKIPISVPIVPEKSLNVEVSVHVIDSKENVEGILENKSKKQKVDVDAVI
jgi:hypothetical protein